MSTDTDLIEQCLRIWHGDGDYGWRLLKQTWPTVAVAGQREKMRAILDLVRTQAREP